MEVGIRLWSQCKWFPKKIELSDNCEVQHSLFSLQIIKVTEMKKPPLKKFFYSTKEEIMEFVKISTQETMLQLQ